MMIVTANVVDRLCVPFPFSFRLPVTSEENGTTGHSANPTSLNNFTHRICTTKKMEERLTLADGSTVQRKIHSDWVETLPSSS